MRIVTDAERLSLNAFLFSCHQMSQSGFGKQFSVAPSRSYRLQGDTASSTKVQQKFTQDEWHAFLVYFRKLLLKKEPGSLLKIINILSRHGSREDQHRLREIKRRLRVSGKTIGNGVAVGALTETGFQPVHGEDVLGAYMNKVLFHNEPESMEQCFNEIDLFAKGAMFHYVIFTYKQSLRLAGAIQLRYDPIRGCL